MKQFLRHAKWCFTGRKQIKNWLFLLFMGVDGLHVAKLDNLNVLFRGGTDDLQLMVDIFTFRNYQKYFPFNKKALIMDIGAHNGYLSLWACANATKGSMIFAYEPAPDNYEIAQANARNNNICNLRLYKKGVTGSGGELMLYLNDKHTGGHSVYKERLMKNGVEKITGIRVDCITLEDVFRENEIDTCDFCKIDCEGAEFDILLNTASDILQKVNVFSIEFHEFGGHKVAELANLLEDNGFIVESSYDQSKLGITYGMLHAIKV